MSIKVMSWVWEESPASGAALLLLLAIADHAADDGANAYPSVKTLMKKTRMSRSSVFRALKELVEYGWLEIESRGVGRETSHYRILMEDFGGVNLTPLEVSERDSRGVNMTPHPSQNDTPEVSERHGRGVNVDTSEVSLLTPRTVLEPSVLPTEARNTYMPASEADDGLFPGPAAAHSPSKDPMARFREFYDAYPRHVAPGRAEKAWLSAIKQGADPQTIISMAKLFAMENRLTEKKLIPYPASWLNDRRWEDEPDPDYAPPVLDVYAPPMAAPGTALVPADPYGGDRYMARQAPRYATPPKPSTTDQRVGEGLYLAQLYRDQGE
jgi:hypothetical protein